ncbi:MAG: response regulator [Treponema sp.]|jgi:two-component system response regulator YesN|nr:response regulator [Treponema sp.]
MYKVVFVDDEPWVIIDMLHSIPWERLGFEVAGHYNKAREAKEIIVQTKPHLVFVDINMPVMDGFELIRRCREEGCGASFVILSGYSDFEFAKQAIREEVLDYCLKPVDPAAMIKTLDYIRLRLGDQTSGKTAAAEKSGGLPEDTPYVPEKEKRFNRILAYIKSHYNTKLSLRELSEQFFLDRNYICSLFKKFTGSTFSNYLVNLRIEKSKELLRATNMPLQLIAEKTGFMDAYYFSRVFKSSSGMPPHKYRVQTRKEAEVDRS